MKSTFPGFYSTSETLLSDIWLSENTIFVFDTNCLLNLYRCEDHTREEILGVMKAISPRIWIPFQVGLEYQRNRRKVIHESVKSLNDVKDSLAKINTNNILSSGGFKKHLYNTLSDEISELQSEIKKLIDSFITDKLEPRIHSKELISKHDSVRDDIDSIILDKIGSIPSQEIINDIDVEGVIRYSNKQPPGFEDENKLTCSFFSGLKLQDKFGDLYLWMQIIDRAKSDEVKNVIFICDDNKSDWYFTQSGKTHGALESLKTEICNEAKIDEFKIINQSSFLHDAKKHLENINISDASLREVSGLSFKSEITEIDFYQDLNEEYKSKFYELSKTLDYEHELSEKLARNSPLKGFPKIEETDLLHTLKNTLSTSESLVLYASKVLNELFTHENDISIQFSPSIYSEIKQQLQMDQRRLRITITQASILLDARYPHRKHNDKVEAIHSVLLRQMKIVETTIEAVERIINDLL